MKLTCDEHLSKFAVKLHLRRYIKAKNNLFYQQDDFPLTVKEMGQCVQGPPKETVSRNTRFVMSVQNQQEQAAAANQQQPGTGDYADRVVKEMAGIGTSGAGGVQKRGAGYSQVVTPSPAPGVDDSPFMTWGDIESTPLRLGRDRHTYIARHIFDTYFPPSCIE